MIAATGRPARARLRGDGWRRAHVFAALLVSIVTLVASAHAPSVRAQEVELTYPVLRIPERPQPYPVRLAAARERCVAVHPPAVWIALTLYFRADGTLRGTSATPSAAPLQRCIERMLTGPVLPPAAGPRSQYLRIPPAAARTP